GGDPSADAAPARGRGRPDGPAERAESRRMDVGDDDPGRPAPDVGVHARRPGGLMRLHFSGAAREVTGSSHLLQVNGRTILLDCGLFQGRRSEVQQKNRTLPYPAERIDAVVLSHAHIDHAGRLPYLVKEGYRGPIHSTVATRDLCEVMLADSAHIQEKDADFLARRKRAYVEPLYALADVSEALTQFRPHRYHDHFDVVPGVKARYVDAGHILGSASVELEWEEEGRVRRLGFSGDIGRAGLPIIRDPEPLERLDW